MEEGYAIDISIDRQTGKIVKMEKVIEDAAESVMRKLVKESCLKRGSDLNKRISKKRFIKLLMSRGINRNKAEDTAFVVWSFRGGYHMLDVFIYS